MLESYLEQRGKSVQRTKTNYSEKGSWRCGTGAQVLQGWEARIKGNGCGQEPGGQGVRVWVEDGVKGSGQL